MKELSMHNYLYMWNTQFKNKKLISNVRRKGLRNIAYVTHIIYNNFTLSQDKEC